MMTLPRGEGIALRHPCKHQLIRQLRKNDMHIRLSTPFPSQLHLFPPGEGCPSPGGSCLVGRRRGGEALGAALHPDQVLLDQQLGGLHALPHICCLLTYHMVSAASFLLRSPVSQTPDALHWAFSIIAGGRTIASSLRKPLHLVSHAVLKLAHRYPSQELRFIRRGFTWAGMYFTPPWRVCNPRSFSDPGDRRYRRCPSA